MPISFLTQRRRNLAGTLRRFLNEQRELAGRIGRLLQSFATERAGGAAVIPNRRSVREKLTQSIWQSLLKPYYWGREGEPFRGTAPQSPFAETLYAGITGAVDIEVAQQVSIIQRVANDEVSDWLLTAPPSTTSPLVTSRKLPYPTFAQWTDPRGFQLTDRVLRVGVDARARVGSFVDYHISQGTPVDSATRRLERFLTTGEQQRTAYGQQGSYQAQRLLVTETKVAAGYAAINASAENPTVKGIQWQLNRPYDETDQCDRNSTGGPNGDGIYPALEVPAYPDHPNEQCDLLPVPADDITDELRRLHDGIVARTEEAMRLAGRFSPEALQAELLGMERQPALSPVSPREWVRQPDGALTWRFRDPNQANPSPSTALLRRRQVERQARLAAAATRPALAAPVLVPALPTYQPSDQVRRMATTYIDNGIAKLAREYKTTPAEIEAKIARAVAELTQGDLAIRVHNERLEDVLSSGRIKTQFETGTSSALIGPGIRANAEYLGMGIPENIEARLRPVYGYVDLGYATRRATNDYGDLAFVLKSEVSSRTGFTVGDSLFNFESGRVASMPITQPSKEAWDNHLRALVEYADKRDLGRLLHHIEYMEIQVQNGVRLGDVRAVRDTAGRLTADQRGRLTQLGIEVWD